MADRRLAAIVIAILTAGAAWLVFNFMGAAASFLCLMPIYIGAPLAPGVWFSLNYFAARSQRGLPAFRGADWLPVFLGVLIGCAMGGMVLHGSNSKAVVATDWFVALLGVAAPSLFVAFLFQHQRLMAPAVAALVAAVVVPAAHLLAIPRVQIMGACMVDLAAWNLIVSAGLWWWACSPKNAGVGDARLCQECRYDLQGNVSGTCPECGTPVSIDTSESLPVPTDRE